MRHHAFGKSGEAGLEQFVRKRSEMEDAAEVAELELALTLLNRLTDGIRAADDDDACLHELLACLAPDPQALRPKR